MAKTRLVDAPPRNDAYVGMLALTVFAMLLGCALFALEANEVEWESQPKGRVKVNLPAVPPKGAATESPATGAGGGATTPAGGAATDAAPPAGGTPPTTGM